LSECDQPPPENLKKRVVKVMRTWIKNFLADDNGQDMIEYSLILVLIGTVALIFLSGLGLSISGIVSKVGFKLETVSNAIS